MSEYEKKLEELVEHLTKMLERRDSGNYVYIVTPKENVFLSADSTKVYLTLREAFAEWCGTLGFSNGIAMTLNPTGFEQIDNVKDKINIFEYNIRTQEKEKVFG